MQSQTTFTLAVVTRIRSSPKEHEFGLALIDHLVRVRMDRSKSTATQRLSGQIRWSSLGQNLKRFGTLEPTWQVIVYSCDFSS